MTPFKEFSLQGLCGDDIPSYLGFHVGKGLRLSVFRVPSPMPWDVVMDLGANTFLACSTELRKDNSIWSPGLLCGVSAGSKR